MSPFKLIGRLGFVALLLFQRGLACNFSFATTCKPRSAILSHQIPEPCCQGKDCHAWDFVSNPQSSRKLIGEGSMGVVRTVTRPTDDTVFVVKSFFPAQDESTAHFASVIQREFDVSTRMQGPGFADVFALLSNDEGVHMISEYLPLPLVKVLPYMDEDDKCCVASMLVQALHRLHKAGYAHRDIKPDNVLLTAHGHAKLIDLGESVSLNRITMGYVGTPPYIAPEVQRYRQTRYDAELADSWSLGMLIHKLYTGDTLCTDSDGRYSILECYVEHEYDPECMVDRSNYFGTWFGPVSGAVDSLLVVNWRHRSTIDHIVRDGTFNGSTCHTDTEGRLHVGVNFV